MATDQQIAANRPNALKSTGPRSVEGKAASSQNALKSGIDSQSQIIRGEDPTALAALTNDYFLEFQPQSASERFLVDSLIDADWLLRRLRKAEAQIWEYHFQQVDDWGRMFKMPPATEDDPIAGPVLKRDHDVFSRLERRRDMLLRNYRRALDELRRIQASHPQPEGPPPPSAPAHPPPRNWLRS